MQSEGYLVEAAADGREALAFVEQHGVPAAVLLDLMMPVMSGWDLIAEMERRNLPTHPSIVVISACRDPGPAGYPHLTKPLNLGALLQAVEERVGG